MFFLDKPFVSDFLKATVRDYHIPVIGTDVVPQLNLLDGTTVFSAEQALNYASGPDAKPIYMNSENAIGWLAQHKQFADLSAKIDLFKDKVKFRDLTRDMFPDFYYRAVTFEDIATLNYDEVTEAAKGAFILKPAVGFFSMGVYFIANRTDWDAAQAAIVQDMAKIQNLYPAEVMDAGKFIIEQCIYGEEYAVDAYFDADGNPVVLGILMHAFASEDDVSDRVYISSKEIIEDNLGPFTEFLREIGRVSGVRTFPVHVELRKDKSGNILPIEVNPMRFGGWCTTADMTAKAYGVNPYLAYLNQEKPDWEAVLADKADKLYALIVLDNSTGLSADEIKGFDYDKLLASLENPLDLRKIDYHEYPVFGFVMTETRADNYAELQALLDSDLSEFVVQ